MDAANEMMNFFATIQQEKQQLRERLSDFINLIDSFSEEEKLVLFLTVLDEQKELSKQPYTVIQGLMKRGILTEVWGSSRSTGSPKITFVGKVKANHKSKEGKL